MTRTIIHAIILNADEYDESLTFDDARYDDYVTNAFFDVDGDACLFHNDNVHGNPDAFLAGLEAGIEVAGDVPDIVELLLFLNDDEQDTNYIDVCTAIRRWIEEEID